MSNVNSESGEPVDLRRIYLKERQNELLKCILEDERICRLCMQATTSEFTSVKEMDIDTLRTYIPEVVSTLFVLRNKYLFKSWQQFRVGTLLTIHKTRNNPDSLTVLMSTSPNIEQVLVFHIFHGHVK